MRNDEEGKRVTTRRRLYGTLALVTLMMEASGAADLILAEP